MNYLAIDVGGTSIKYALVDDTGEVGPLQQLATPRDNLATFMTTLIKVIAPYQAQIDGIGLTIPGTVNPKTGEILACATLPFLEDLYLSVELTQVLQLKVPVVLENDGNAAALAEHWLGHLAGVNNGAMVVLGTGIGVSIFINGQLYYGSHFTGGESSFMVTDLSQTELRAQTGAPLSAVKTVTAIATELNLTGNDIGPRVFEVLERRQEPAWSLFQTFTRGVTALIYNMQTTLDMERIVIGGGISVQPLLINQLKQDFQVFHDATTLSKRTIFAPEIVAAHFHNDANLMGAIYPLLNQN